MLTAKRQEILKAMCDAGALTVREISQCVERDVKSVHTHRTALLNAAVLDRAGTGQVVFPCESVKVESLLHAA